MPRSVLILISSCLISPAWAADGGLSITNRFFHLGDSPHPDWKEFASEKPDAGRAIDIHFESKEDEKRQLILELQAGGVSNDWKVKINETEVGALEKKDERTTHFFRVPPSTLKSGKNRLTIATDRDGDDIYVGKATLHDRPLSELKGYAKVRVTVRDGDTGQGIPCRITVASIGEEKQKTKDKDGKEVEKVVAVEKLAKLFAAAHPDLAIRDGIIYTKVGAAAFEVPPGEYVIYATRGFEYGLAEARLKLGRLAERAVELEIRREVDTTGYLAADTHVHTKTYSGHGNANLEERVICITGEGVEVAVATDHNHHTDYTPTMEKVGVQDRFLSIVGNEVTSATIGHFNAFPMDKDQKPPDHDHGDWTRLVKAMRASPGVRVVILNHPRRDITRGSPLERIRYNHLTGEAHRGPEDLGLNAIEILNGKTLQDEYMVTLKDWFGLLNRGYRMAAVGGSDSHSVEEIVGQTRTYVASSTDDPRKMQVQEVCDGFLAGRLLVSLGLLAEVEVDGRYRPGDLATPYARTLRVKVRVQGPSWTRATKVALYLNGIETRKEAIEPGEKPVKYEAVWEVPAPGQDAHLVVVATGPPVTAVYWPIAGATKDKKYVLGATNPVWLDGDGDGKFTSAFEYASTLVRQHGMRGEALHADLAKHDTAVVAQFASIARAQIEKEAQEAYERLMLKADRDLEELLRVGTEGVKKGFKDYLAAAPRVEVRTRWEAEEEEKRLKKEEEERRKRREEEAKKKVEEEKKKKEEEEKKRKAGRKGKV